MPYDCSSLPDLPDDLTFLSHEQQYRKSNSPNWYIFVTILTYNISFLVDDADLLALLNQLQQVDQVDNLSGYSRTCLEYASAETNCKSRQASNDKSWEGGREKLFDEFIKFEGISSFCNQCGASQLPIIRFRHCCKYLCCIVHVIHSRMTILNGLRSNLLPMYFVSSDETCFANVRLGRFRARENTGRRW